MTGQVVQINVSRGGVPKRPVLEAEVTLLGLEGDAHRDTQHHGGPDRALCLFSLERIEALRREGHPMTPGAIGENLTVAGLDWERVAPGDRFRIGADVLVEVSRFTSPCANIRGAFADGAYARVAQVRHPGWSRVYARVLAPGRIRAGDAIVPVPASPAVSTTSGQTDP